MNTLLSQLSEQLDGELHFDDLMKSLYATDASVYRQLPLAVALPRNDKDIQKLVSFAKKNGTSLIPRGAGTSLAGQCVGDGIVVDVSKYMNEIIQLDPENGWVKVQPGVIRDELNEFLKPYGWFFGPNTSTANRCNIGGMVGNNSCGSTSIVYGTTRDHVLELKSILSDGSVAVFKALSRTDLNSKQNGDQFENKLYRDLTSILNETTVSTIKENYPKAEVSRRNTGYALDTLINMAPLGSEPFNFCSLLCGSEGTLAITTEITLNLVPLQKPHVVVLAAHFDDLETSLNATVLAMGHKPTACEMMDRTILNCTKGHLEHEKNRFFLEGDPETILMIEFREDNEQLTVEKAQNLISELKASSMGYAFPILKGDDTNKVWDLRKAGLGLLANIPGDKKAVACIEDTAVALTDLPSYIKDFSKLMASFNQEAVYYAHAGAGELHLRPILDLKTKDGVTAFRAISEASARLVKSYNGSLSGEHGDGRVRTEFIPLVLGEEVNKILHEIKHSWDPDNIFNPGKIVNGVLMDKDLRYKTDIPTKEIDSIFNFEETGGLLRTVEKCNGSGDCRKLNFAGGTMCPSYRATLDEKDSTRGRANTLREFLTQSTKENPFDHPEIKTAMDLCISCKGCKSECPSNIDMATLKSEFLYQYQEQNGVSFRSKMIAHNAKWNARFYQFKGVINFFGKRSWFKSLLGISQNRDLPKLQRTTLKKWLMSYDQPAHERCVYLFIDEYTNFYDVQIGIKTVKLLNALGYSVKWKDHSESGRACISKGLLKEARGYAESNVKTFSHLVNSDCPLIGIEPSAILSFRDEYPNLVRTEFREKSRALSKHVKTIEEFLSTEVDKGNIQSSSFKRDSSSIKYHGHCHQKALSNTDFSLNILRLPMNYSVTEIPSGCCGMAGSFGYEKEHYDLSMAIGQQTLFPAIKEAEGSDIIVASGTSCRHQIKDGTDRSALHPIEVLYDALIDKK